MKEAKDLFSTQAGTYATFRPVYPQALYDFIYSQLTHFNTAWDCATGNGQVANILSLRFDKVFATDLSEKQIAHAVQRNNIEYSVTRAEHTSFTDQTFDLVTVGTAIHWFDFDAFYAEVKRVCKPGALVAVWAYAPFRSRTKIDHIIDHFTYDIMGPYWDPERKYVDEQYKNIPFPFEEISTPGFEITLNWGREQFIGFINSWSSVHHYINRHGNNPVSLIEAELAAEWKDDEILTLRFPLFVRMGRVS